jgi:DNA-binding response OmpR family regulator
MNFPNVILVVDDETVIMETFVMILNSFTAEFLAIGFTKVDEALALVRGIHPDLVLLDVVMPGVERLEHAIELREKFGCTVLMMSGRTETNDLLEQLVLEGHPPFEILAKPIHPMDLVQKIREVLQQPRQSSRAMEA